MRFICYGYPGSDSTGKIRKDLFNIGVSSRFRLSLTKSKTTDNYTSNMSQFSATSLYQQHTMDASTEMIASAMMLMSLSESAVVHTGYNSRSSFSPSSSANNSGTSLSGWGSTKTRKSYKVDLYSLGSSASQPMDESSPNEESVASNTNDSWGFYDM